MTRSSHRDGLHGRFLRLSVPNILSNLLVPLASAIDVALLGHLAAVRDLAGVALATVIFDYVLWTFGFLRMATTGLTAQARGRHRADEERIIALRGVGIGVAVGLALVLLQVPLRELGFAVLQGGEDLQEAARAYYGARIWGAPFTLANYALLGWLLGREQSRRALVMSAVGHGANIVFDWIFIAGMGLGAAGAGAATALSQVLMFVGGVLLVRQALPWAEVRRLLPHVRERAALRGFFSLSADITVRTLLLVSAFAVFTNLAAAMGTAVLAATAVLRQVVMLAAWFVDGFAFAVESLAGVFAGSGDRTSLRRVLRLSLVWGLGTSTIFALAFVLLPRPLFGLLTDHAEILDLVEHYAIWLLPVLVFSAPAYVLDGYFLGLTRGRVLRRAMVVSALVGFAPLAVAAHVSGNAHVLWAALGVFMLARTITLGRRVPPTLSGPEAP